MNMKSLNNPIFLAIVLMISTQVETKAQATFGIRGGLNATTVSFEKLPNKSEKFGYHLGVFVDLPVSTDFISLQPELSYSTKGVTFKPLNQRQTQNLNYIDLYLPVAFHLGAIDVQVGAFTSFLTSTADYTVFEDRTLIIDAFKKYDVGLTAGLSYNFSKLFFGLRFNQGFVDVTTDESRPFLGSGKNTVGQVSMGYKF